MGEHLVLECGGEKGWRRTHGRGLDGDPDEKEEEEEEPYLRTFACMYALLDLFCTPVPYLPLLFQGVSASGLPTNRYP